VLVDGAIVEVFFNGEVVTLLAEHATEPTVSLEVEQGAGLVSMEAFKMAPSME
jgi:hypothetical protein